MSQAPPGTRAYRWTMKQMRQQVVVREGCDTLDKVSCHLPDDIATVDVATPVHLLHLLHPHPLSQATPRTSQLVVMFCFK